MEREGVDAVLKLLPGMMGGMIKMSMR